MFCPAVVRLRTGVDRLGVHPHIAKTDVEAEGYRGIAWDCENEQKRMELTSLANECQHPFAYSFIINISE